MISYAPLWQTMEDKGITKYQLVHHYGFSSNTIRRLQHNEGMNMTTLNKLCLILQCGVLDIISYEATEKEKKAISAEKERLEELRGIHFSI